MKKFLTAILAVCLALSCTFALAACTKDPPSSDDPSTQNPPSENPDTPSDPDEPDEPDTPSEPDEPDEPDEPVKPEPIDCGAFARKWVAYGYTLDLVECTLTGSGYDGFEVVSMEGEGESAVISCKAGDKTYTLTLNDEGALELKNGDAAELTFLAANPFAGAWAPDDPYMFTYYMFSPEIGADGTFAWDQYAYEIDEPLELDGTATTVFSIGESGADVSLKLNYGTVTLADGVAHFDDGYGWAYDLLPYTDNVKEGSYFDEAGAVFSYQEGKFSLGGKSAAAEAKASAYGSGLSFTVDGKDYLFQVGPAGEYIVTDGVAHRAYPYQTDLLVGAWSDNDGNTLVFQDGEEVKYNDVAYALAPSVKLGEIVIGFSAGTNKYEIRFTDVEVALEFSDTYGVSSVFVRDDFKKEYVGGYTNYLDAFEIGEDYAMKNKIDGGDTLFPASAKGSFEYLTEEDFTDIDEELTVVAYSFGNYAMFCFPTESCDPFLVFEKTDGIYETYCVLYAESDLPAIIELFNAGLEGEEDVFTTGGTSPDTLSIDFEGGTVTATGAHPVTGATFYLDLDEYGSPVLCYLSDDNSVFHTVQPSALGLYDTMFSLDTEEEPDEKSYISKEQYEKLLGMSFVYHGPYYDEMIVIGEDGTLSLSTTDYTESDDAITLVKYPYQLTRYTFFGESIIGLAFSVEGSTLTLLVNIYDLQYATVMGVQYCRADLSPFVGVYEAGDKTIELTVQATVVVDGAEMELTSPVTVTDGKATATYTADGTSYTVEFTAESATLSGVTYTKNTNVFELDKFVGVYTVGEHEVEVKVTAIGINIPLSVVATVDGTSATYETSFTEDGQVLTISALDFMTFETVTITLTLKGDQITVSDGTNSATAEAADWDFEKFVFEEDLALTDSEGTVHNLICLPKEGGKAPLFFYDDKETMCTEYIVAKGADGTYTLTLSAGIETVVITCNADGTLTASYPASDIPLPPPPLPAPPAPPAP